MVSFDITSLYTQVPLQEVITICTDKIYESSTFFGLTKLDFSKLLQVTLKGTHFLFNKIMYEQVDGLAMGNPIAPSLANIFLGELETNFLAECPDDFKPLFYRRYLDDTFVIFREKNNVQQFLNYINSQHRNITKYRSSMF